MIRHVSEILTYPSEAYKDALRISPEAAREARTYSAAAASHLRIMAEDTANSGYRNGFAFYSIAWTVIIRDAIHAAAVGRALELQVTVYRTKVARLT